MTSDALAIYREKLAHLERELAICSDATQKFTIEKAIEEVKGKINDQERRGSSSAEEDKASKGQPEPATSTATGHKQGFAPRVSEAHKTSTDEENRDTPRDNQTAIREVVLIFHGIRDRAAWGQDIIEALAKPGRVVEVVPYGRVGLPLFMCPIPFVWLYRRKVSKALRNSFRYFPQATTSIIAHSFGTFNVARALSREKELKIERLILCGSIVKREFDWMDIANCFASRDLRQRIVNDVGASDPWPVVANAFSYYYGDSGTYGSQTLIKDRFHKGSHSAFLDKAFAKKYWRPFLEDGTIKQPASFDLAKERQQLPYWAKFLEYQLVGLIAKPALIAAYVAIFIVLAIYGKSLLPPYPDDPGTIAELVCDLASENVRDDGPTTRITEILLEADALVQDDPSTADIDLATLRSSDAFRATEVDSPTDPVTNLLIGTVLLTHAEALAKLFDEDKDRLVDARAPLEEAIQKLNRFLPSPDETIRPEALTQDLLWAYRAVAICGHMELGSVLDRTSKKVKAIDHYRTSSELTESLPTNTRAGDLYSFVLRRALVASHNAALIFDSNGFTRPARLLAGRASQYGKRMTFDGKPYARLECAANAQLHGRLMRQLKYPMEETLKAFDSATSHFKRLGDFAESSTRMGICMLGRGRSQRGDNSRRRTAIGDVKEAIILLGPGATSDPYAANALAFAHAELGSLYLEQKDTKAQALDEYRRAIEIRRPFASSFREREADQALRRVTREHAWLLANCEVQELRQFKQAKSIAEMLVSVPKESPEDIRLMGVVNYRLAEQEEAVKQLMAALGRFKLRAIDLSNEAQPLYESGITPDSLTAQLEAPRDFYSLIFLSMAIAKTKINQRDSDLELHPMELFNESKRVMEVTRPGELPYQRALKEARQVLERTGWLDASR